METHVPSFDSEFGPCVLDARRILEAAPDCICIASRDDLILYANPAACSATDYESSELQTMSLPELLTVDVPRLHAVIEQERSGSPIRREWRLARKNGTGRLTDLALRTFLIVGVWRLARDVTDRKRNEMRNVTHRRALELLATDAPFAEILNAIACGIEAELNGTLCSILLLDEEGRSQRTAAAPSLSPFFSGTRDSEMFGKDFGSRWIARYARQRMIAVDIERDAAWKQLRLFTARAGVRSCWSEPVLSTKDICLGIFVIFQRVPGGRERRMWNQCATRRTRPAWPSKRAAES